VLSDGGEPLGRYPLSIEQVAQPESIALIVYAMQQVVLDGTARAIGDRFGRAPGYAGKTGTSDGYRDSWYAGFSGDYLMVVWVGRDDNESTGLSGASGAAHIWSDTFANITTRPLTLTLLPGLTFIPVNPLTGMQIDASCSNAVTLPYIANYEPASQSGCATGTSNTNITNTDGTQKKTNKRRGVDEWLKGIFK
jgi:penicillin-binding protein 1B